MSNNFLHSLLQRELNGDPHSKFQRKYHVTLQHIKRLGLQKELEGHQGCVNCLSWNQSGNLLASGSDDAQVIIWDAFNHRTVSTIPTGHTGNIFSAKFIPNGTDNLVVSGAADSQIRVHDVTSKECTDVIKSHRGRVKRLAVTPDQPHLFWSCSEDGTVRQFDLRDSDTLSSNERHSLLIDLTKHTGANCEVKCLNINPVFSHQLAIGANDPYARVYDRRMMYSRIRDSSWTSNENACEGCVDYYVAGHLSAHGGDPYRGRRAFAATYVAFSPSGRELLVNLGGEQAYIFDVNNKRRRQKLDLIPRGSEGELLSTSAVVAESADSEGSEHADGEHTVADEKGEKTPQNGFRNGVRKTSSPDISTVQTLIHLSTPSSSSSSISSCENAQASQGHKTLQNRRRKQRGKQWLLVENMRKQAGELFKKNNFSQAISLYNHAIDLDPHSSVLYCNRAIALYKRAWDGDDYAALRDCYSAILLDNSNFKAHFRLVKCLVALQWMEEAKACLEIVQSKFSRSTELICLEHLLRKETKKVKDKEMGASSNRFRDSPPSSETELSRLEQTHREMSFDYDQRFCGHCNTTTDIKEANFFGSDGQFVVAGSDDGSFFIWHRKTSNIIRILNGDLSIVNCLEPHPTSCILATSGIESVVRLWEVQDGSKNDREVSDSDTVAQANQTRMNLDPLELVLLSMGYHISTPQSEERPPNDNPSSPVYCRPS